MTTPSFNIYNSLETLQESGLAGLTVNDKASASSNVLWTSAKINSIQPTFAKYSAPVQTIGTEASAILFATLVGSSSLTGSTGSIAVADGVVTLTSLTTAASSWKIDFNPNYATNEASTTVTFQLQTPSGTDAGNSSQVDIASTTAFGTGNINEFITVPASSSTTLQVNAVSSTADTSLGVDSSLPYISILQIV